MDISNKIKKREFDKLCINSIRVLVMDAIQKAKSGHPGASIGLASVGYVLWTRVLKHNPKNPDWQNRDRFILSCGHTSMLLYSLMYLTGYDLTLNDIKNFRQFRSKTPGHPEYLTSNAVEVTTGPLGQGFANGIGMAIAECHMSTKYNRNNYSIIDHYTYVICSDGDLMEGVTSEAASYAGHLGLSKLICIYDSNDITIEGNTNLTFTENIITRFQSYDWQVIMVLDGNDLNEIENAFNLAKSEVLKPSLIILKTKIAYGSPNLEGSSKSHGAPLGRKEVKLTKMVLGWLYSEPFFVPGNVLDYFKKYSIKCELYESSWNDLFKSYSLRYPVLANDYINVLSRFITRDWNSDVPNYNNFDLKVSTREASGKILNSIALKVPSLVGGSADLSPSNKTYIYTSSDFQKGSYIGRNMFFGVREFAMGSIMSGMFLHGGIRPFGGTFLVFSDYMRSSIRMASIMKLPIIYIFTHDSVAVGEDGPTHQPIEHLASLRTIPGLIVIRPADANETYEAWSIAILSNNRPVAIILSRQKLPVINYSQTKNGVAKGAYIVSDCNKKPDIVIVATGSELCIALDAKKILKNNGINVNVISMPSWELFEEQTVLYKDKVLPPNSNRVIIEAGIRMGWERYMSKNSVFIGINEFGYSAPGKEVMNYYGITVDNVVINSLKIINNNL